MTSEPRPHRPVSLPPVRSAFVAPFAIALRELEDVISRPGPFFGGLFGTALGCAAVIAAMLWLPSDAVAEPEPEFVVEFMPASMLAASDLDAEPSVDPQPQPVAEPVAEPQPDEPGATVSSDAVVPSSKPKPGSKPNPKPSTEPSPKPSPAPSPGPNNPFTESGAWSDLVADGDPWAAAVMRALRAMKVPAWGGKLSAEQPFGFRLRVCKDGRVDRVLRKHSTGDADLDATLEYEISRVDIPAVPPAMAAEMTRDCMVLDYEFTWLPTGVR